jgi:hypothetical protein
MNDQKIDFVLNADELYREESIIDLKVGAIRCLVPVKQNGAEDNSRRTMYFAHTQLMSPQGPVPLQAKLKATTLEEAVEQFPKAMRLAMEAMMERARSAQSMQGGGQPKGGNSPIMMPGK